MKKFLFVLLLLTVFNAHARQGFLEGLGLGPADEAPPLVEEAFQFSAEVDDSNTIIARWQVMEGNYLYRDKLRFEVVGNDNVRIGNFILPQGENKNDETFGLVQVYPHDLALKLPLSRPQATQQITLRAYFQGCSETFGICYPPSQQQVDLILPAATASTADTAVPTVAGTVSSNGNPLSEQDRLAQKLAEDNLWQIFFGFLGLGLLLTFTPCVLPMIPILSSIIIGEGEKVTTRRAFSLSLVYVLAMSLTYTAAGMLTGLAGENLQSLFQTPWVLGSFSLLFVLLALSMFGLYDLQLPQTLQQRLHQLSHRQRGGSYVGVAVMGLLSALIVGPCLAPPLAAALIFIGQHADPMLGGLALFALSIGMGIPLLIIGTSAGSLLPRAGDWMNSIKAVFGVLLLGLAIWMLERIVPGWISLLLWGGLLIVCAVYMGALNSLQIDASGWSKLYKGLGLILLVFGVMLIIGGASGSDNRWQPLQHIAANSDASSASQPRLQFTPVNNLAELEARLNSTAQPVMLDFYADWCTDCKTMEQTTFRDPAVVAALAEYQLLKLDMTDNTKAHQQMLQALQVFGPPTMLFFSARGEEWRDYRLVGHIKADAMLQHLSRLPQ